MPPRDRSPLGLLLRSFTTFVVAVVVGGLAVGACLAALIPGAVEIATAHHYTADSVKNLRGLTQQSTVYWNDGVTPMPCGQLGIEIHDPVCVGRRRAAPPGERGASPPRTARSGRTTASTSARSSAPL